MLYFNTYMRMDPNKERHISIHLVFGQESMETTHVVLLRLRFG